MISYKKMIKKIRLYWLLLFSIATSFCCYGQENNDENIDSLIDELFFDDQQFLDEILESNYTYNFIYTSLSYNSNTFFSGRDSGTDQFNIIPQVSFYHSSGFNASISGIYYENFAPSWDFTSVSLGYFKTFGKSKNGMYNLGYTKYFYSEDFDDFTNSLDVSLGVRNKKRTLGTTLAASYIFGTDESYQIVSNSFANFTLSRTANFALRFRPNISFVIANQTFGKYTIRIINGRRVLEYTSTEVFNLLNTQIGFPISFSKKSWDVELGYYLNIPKPVANETNLSNTSFVGLSIGYLFDVTRKK
ncbi:MAG: hypothetical protein COZ16_02875 [Flavobacteriaceae bacterium CG_4_10_14_3_um_filter_31_253]|nr:MAG: hypothetical protein COW43_09050 [Flavobacteriaceae bacterium CG17_big_fil_post_rev_8_21_14_2_50_31_13]PIX14774.1 MAG: hypothetical protein COZ74_01990 [Flavobacteriaceae bacterium CG_4_8_14_3_um_filter_31_8]PIY15778.1 MAG: hypothetical protein COZ16_02875 [Flavobacteriaceae bacterium CG_4_10_14_3_um_filter_31_253]PIZ10687.1 MAG: hypothetical protein COY55_07705 [Flavobacteriaceae bacterium CG_4_10_14_0_8_um_filter_31_99]PJC09061.1 MAG: hypothetical protein CO067_11640 [Flavobacteriacea